MIKRVNSKLIGCGAHATSIFSGDANAGFIEPASFTYSEHKFSFVRTHWHFYCEALCGEEKLTVFYDDVGYNTATYVRLYKYQFFTRYSG